MFKTVLVTTIPAHPYFWPKTGERDVSLTSFTAKLPKPSKILFSECVKLIRKGACKVWWRYLLSFFSYGTKSGGGVSPPPPFGALVKQFFAHCLLLVTPFSAVVLPSKAWHVIVFPTGLALWSGQLPPQLHVILAQIRRYKGWGIKENQRGEFSDRQSAKRDAIF